MEINTNKQAENKKQSKIYTTLGKAYERMLRIRGEPREIALGFALGLFVGMSPFMGFQILIVVFLASVLKWNKISAVIGVWISNPITAPIIYGFTYFTGANLLGIHKMEMLSEIDPATGITALSKAPEIIWALIVGGGVIGFPLAVLGYYFSYSAVKKYQEDFKIKLAQQKKKRAKRKEEKKKKKRKKKNR
jgi:uncharacterized protein (DUF2062 family)